MIKYLFLATIICFLCSCSKNSTNKDPWEKMNRLTFTFNDNLDSYFIKPVAQKYEEYMPNFLKKGIGNVLNNLNEPRNILNSILQGELKNAASDTSRFIINSTFGILGLMDIATDLELEKNNKDFGQTLGKWGMPSGPYLMLPILGPSTLRDAFGKTFDIYSDSKRALIKCKPYRLCLNIAEDFNKRVDLLTFEKLINGDRYSFVRNAFLDNREFKINNDKVIDDF